MGGTRGWVTAGIGGIGLWLAGATAQAQEPQRPARDLPVEEARARADEARSARAAEMLARAKEFLVEGEYREAERLARAAARLDPGNRDALALLQVAGEYASEYGEDVSWPGGPSTESHWRDAVEAGERALTPVERAWFAQGPRGDESPAPAAVPEWESRLREKLAQPVDDLVLEAGTTFGDVRRMLSARFGVTIVVDQGFRSADEAAVELRVSDPIPLGDLLTLLTDHFLSDMTYVLKNQAVVVLGRDAARETTAVTRVYNVDDILATINAGRRSSRDDWHRAGLLDDAGLGAGFGNGLIDPALGIEDLVEDEDEDEVTAADLADAIGRAIER